MKTTLWTRDEVARAMPLIERLESDVRDAWTRVCHAVEAVRYHEEDFRVAPTKDSPALWIEVVRAQDELDAAKSQMQTLSEELEALNGEIDFEDECGIRLAGLEDGLLVYWSIFDGMVGAEPVFALEPETLSVG